MSLLQRVERAQQGADNPSAVASLPVEPAAPPKPVQAPSRDALLRDIKVRLQAEAMRAFDALRDVAGAADARSKVEGIVDRVIDAHGFVVTRDERLRLIEEVADNLTGFGPLEPLLRDETITEVMVNGPRHIYIERGGKDRARR